MAQARYALRAGLVALTLASGSSCTSKPTPGAGPSTSPSASSTAPAGSAAQAPFAGDDQGGEVKPVYPETNEPPDPQAERYCRLIYEAPETKRKECCPSVPFTAFRPTDQCVRTLSFALRSKAVALGEAALGACEAAILDEAKRCDWGGTMPAACEGIVRGQLDENAKCRSSLECKEGLHCGGLGAVTPGTCVPRGVTGTPCGGSTDTLAAFVRQDAERAHPQCGGQCERRRCADTVALGGKCGSSLQCGQGRFCLQQKCTDTPLPVAGKPCAQKMCAEGLACVNDMCSALRRLEEGCESDAECRSAHCERPDGGAGKCAMSCRIIKPKSASPGAPSARPERP
jgi:hypothetical protein